MPKHGGRVVTVPLNMPNVDSLALALDQDGRCVGWAEVVQELSRYPVSACLHGVLMERKDPINEQLDAKLGRTRPPRPAETDGHEREPRVIMVPLGSERVECLALALDEAGHCVAWAEVPSEEAKPVVVLALKSVLRQHEREMEPAGELSDAS